MNSILQTERACFLCGRNGAGDPLDVHHVFFGTANRKISEKYGLTVYLCHSRCHIFAPGSVHQNAKVDTRLKRFAQIEAQKHYNWNEDEFRQIFGRSYL